MIARVERWYGREWSVLLSHLSNHREFWSLDRSDAERLAAAINEWALGDRDQRSRPLGFNGDGSIRLLGQSVISSGDAT